MKVIEIKGVIVPAEDAWIYNLFGYEYTDEKSFKEALANANGEDVKILINSCGGDVFTATEIYDAITAYEGNISIKVIWAASAASVIACAAESEIAPTGMFMIHNAIGSGHGNYQDMRYTSDVLLKVSKAIGTAYRLKTKLSDEEIQKYMDEETYFTAEEAVELGFIDKISEGQSSSINNKVAFAASLRGLLPFEVIEAKKQELANTKSYLNLLKISEVKE
ncbi:MAG: head maturation protease, ClpP-related [Ruminococcus sp.]